MASWPAASAFGRPTGHHMLSRSSGGLAAEGGYWRVGTAPAQPGRGWQNLGEAAVVDPPWFQLKLAQGALPGRGTIDHSLLPPPPVLLSPFLPHHDPALFLSPP